MLLITYYYYYYYYYYYDLWEWGRIPVFPHTNIILLTFCSPFTEIELKGVTLSPVFDGLLFQTIIKFERRTPRGFREQKENLSHIVLCCELTTFRLFGCGN